MGSKPIGFRMKGLMRFDLILIEQFSLDYEEVDRKAYSISFDV